MEAQSYRHEMQNSMIVAGSDSVYLYTSCHVGSTCLGGQTVRTTQFGMETIEFVEAGEMDVDGTTTLGSLSDIDGGAEGNPQLLFERCQVLTL